MSGLDAEQLDELEYRVTELLEEPWDKEERYSKLSYYGLPGVQVDISRNFAVAAEDN